MGPTGRRSPWNRSHSAFSDTSGCSAVISATTMRRAAAVSAATNGARPGTL